MDYDDTPEDFDLTSPDGTCHVRVEFGYKKPSVLSSGYGKPFYKVKVTVAAVAALDHELVVWHKDAERVQVAFAENSQYLEICSEIAGCIFNSSGVRYFREVYHLPSGLEVVSASSDFLKDEETSSRPNPVGSKASVHISHMIRTRLGESYKSWEQLKHREALLALLEVIDESRIDLSGSDGAVRHLVSLLCRDLAYWSDEEVQLRLVIVRILNRISVSSSKDFIDLLIPRGRIKEPVRDEHNRLADAFGQKLIDADQCKSPKT